MQLRSRGPAVAIAAAGLVFLAAGCGTDGSTGKASAEPADCPTTTQEIQRTIFAPRCGSSGCHEALDPAQGLDLVSPELEVRLAGLVGGCRRPILTPGSPDESYLLTKVSRREPSCGAPMPLDREPLSSHDVSCLAQWIERLTPVEATSVDGAIEAPDGGDGGTVSIPVLSCDAGTIACGSTCIPAIEPTFSAIHTSILERSCVFDSCHGGTAPKEHLALNTADVAFENLVGVPSRQRPELSRVDPGHPELSYVVNKLRGIELGLVTTTGDPSQVMPLPPNKPLCEVKIATIEEWIRRGGVR